MPEVDARFEQLLHSDRGQTASLLDCIPGGGTGPEFDARVGEQIEQRT
jgi:hypothetical protein